MSTDKSELKPIEMIEQSQCKTSLSNSSSPTNFGSITSHKIVFTPKEICINDHIALIHIKSIKFSPADYNKKSVKNLLCGELLYRIKRYLSHNEKASIDNIVKSFNNKFENIVTIESIESIDAFLQYNQNYEQCKTNTDKANKSRQNIHHSTELGL